MLVVLGLYIPLSREVELRPRHYLSTMAIVVAAGFVSFYLNSAFAVPVEAREQEQVKHDLKIIQINYQSVG